MVLKNNSKILFLAGTEFLRTYSGTLYLIETLIKKKFDLTVYVRCKAKKKKEYEELPFRCYPITEHPFLREVKWAKRFNNRMKLVQFCQELYIPEEEPGNHIAHFYSRYACVPDLVIDVEPNRAGLRQRLFGLKETPLVLPNSLPTSAVPPRAHRGKLAELAGTPLPDDVPIVLYTGGIGKEKPLERVIDVISMAMLPVYFLSFCNASEYDISKLIDYARAKLPFGNFRIRSSIKKEVLLASTWEADIGVIDYSYSIEPSSNQKFCAPTKLYEYMASGLAILGSNNKSLKDIIEKEGIGCCSKDDTVLSMANALNSLIEDIERLKQINHRSESLYHYKYCYEKLCKKQISKICDFLQ
jgi:glycosyltransferase involved in cell wall biosynthesis